MDWTNMFNPFAHKDNHHEDQATRALAVVLRYSPTALNAFVDHLRQRLTTLLAEPETYLIHNTPNTAEPHRVLNALYDDAGEIGIHTQVGSLPSDQITTIVSCALSEQQAETLAVIEIGIEGRLGDARYDLVVHFVDSQLAVVLESKKHSVTPAVDQLRLAERDIEDRLVLPWALQLSWRELTGRMLSRSYSRRSGPAERAVIEDLVFYLSEHHPDLSPIMPLAHLTHEQDELIFLRLEQAMKMLQDPEHPASSGRYRGGSHVYIETEIPAVARLNSGLIGSNGTCNFELSAHFGDTQSQSINFFKSGFSVDSLRDLERQEGWHVKPNFHVHFVGTHLVWYTTSPEELRKYLEFWRSPDGDGWRRLQQTDRDGLRQLLDDIETHGLIQRETDIRGEEKRKFWDTSRTRFNIAAGLSITYCCPYDSIATVDRTQNIEPLVSLMAEKFAHALNAAGVTEKDIQKSALNAQKLIVSC